MLQKKTMQVITTHNHPRIACHNGMLGMLDEPQATIIIGVSPTVSYHSLRIQGCGY
jgi:hypothetical protein